MEIRIEFGSPPMELLEKLGVEPLVLLAQVVNFGILFAILTYFLYRPILRLLDRRRATIEKGLNDARVYKEKMEWLNQEIARRCTEADDEARRIKLSATETAEHIISKAREESVAERAMLLADAEMRIASERRAALAGLERDIGELAIAAAEKIVRDHWDQKVEGRFIAELVSNQPANRRLD
jgi:F-type H+-transporting ATPase subunit b